MISLLCVVFVITVELFLKHLELYGYRYIALGLNETLQLSGLLSAKHYGKYILKTEQHNTRQLELFLLLLLNIHEYS